MKDVRFEDKNLEQVEADPKVTGGLTPALVKLFRRRMQLIRDAADERDFYNLKSLHFEKLKGPRQGQRSIRLNDQYRLIVRIDEEHSEKTIVIVEITDYH